MKKYNRGDSPVDLNGIEKECRQSGIDPWEYFCKQHRDMHDQLSVSLYEAQLHYCAYCECRLKHPSTAKNSHIEHLERRSDNPNRIFDWSNMFLSCINKDSCGKFKDESKPKIVFNIQDIIDPSHEDPQDFFQYDALGRISPRDDISFSSQKRAQETIRVLNLNSARLCNIRKSIASIVKTYQENEDEDEEIDFFLANLGNTDCLSVYYSLLGRRMP